MRKISVYIIIFFCLLPVMLIASDKINIHDPLSFQTTITTNGKDSSYNLPHRYLIPETFELYLNGMMLKQDVDYTVFFIEGILRFKSLPDSGLIHKANYKRLPFNLPHKYSRWHISDTLTSVPEQERPRVRSQPMQKQGPTRFGEELQSNGSVFRGITVGTNQGMRLQSGLRLQVSGKIAPNVELVASLTDQNTPIQPEGNTQTLQEIDKVFIDIKMNRFKATLGDFVYQTGGTEFGTYSRKLQGAMGAYESDNGSLTFSVAASKGEFTSNYFNGQEGSQGPYQLTGTAGQREIIILAGTERIWIDGELMIRGEDNDYVIEYGNGQVTFTRNRLITSDSRITVDFEYSDQKFQKTIYGITGSAQLWRDRVELKTSFLREGDDKDEPLDLPLTEAYRDVLEKAGDHPDSATVSGAEYVGHNQGYYIKRDTLEGDYYQYVGEAEGDYIVRFSYVGTGRGDYSFQGYGIYRYEGTGQGDYQPVVFLSLARHHQMLNLASKIDFGRGFLLDSEVGLSDQDQNLYSADDDDDNIGLAYNSQLHMKNQHIGLFGKKLGKAGFQARLRRVGQQFRSLGRMSEVEHGRRWGTEEGEYWGETIQELKADYQPVPSLSVSGEMGSFKKGEKFSSVRKMVETDFNDHKWPHIRYKSELIESQKENSIDGYWHRHRGSVRGKWWQLQPSVHYDGEHRKESSPDSILSGFKFDEWTGRLELGDGAFRLQFDEIVRDDRKYSLDALEKESLAKTDRFQLEWRIRHHFSASFLFTHRDRDYTDSSREDTKTDLADVKMHFSSSRQFLNGKMNYQFSSTQASQMVKDTVVVGEGLGNYRYDEDLDEYVPDPDGDILFRTLQTGTFMPVNTVKGGLELRLNNSGLWRRPEGLLNIVGSLKSLSRIRIERKDKEQDFFKVNQSAIRPQWGQDTMLVSGLFSYHQDVEYLPKQGKLMVRLRYRQEDSESHQFSQESILRHSQEQSTRIKSNPLKKLGILFEYQKYTEIKTYQSGISSDRSIRSHLWILETSYRPKQKIEIAVKGKIKIARDVVPDPVTEAVSFFIVPRFRYAFLGKGHFRAELELGEIRSDPSDRSLPFEMFNGDQPGQTLRWNVLLTYKVTGHVMATLSYRARREPWRDQLYQTGQMEVRAFF